MFAKENSQTRRTRKNIFTRRTLFCKCANVQIANVQMCKNCLCTKCANLQRKLFSKCRNHKSALCTKTQMQLSAHVTILSVHNSANEKFLQMQILFLCARVKNVLVHLKIKYYSRKIICTLKIIIINIKILFYKNCTYFKNIL